MPTENGWSSGGTSPVLLPAPQSAAFAGMLLTLLRRAEAIDRGSAARATEQPTANTWSADDEVR
jgi:hypothetical protein